MSKQKVEIETKMFMQEKENVDHMLRGNAIGFLKIQISNSLKDLKHHLERCNEAHLKILELSNSIEDSKWIDNLYGLYDEI